jgi:phospholipase/carboxylesterase/glyoxalase family protein
MQTNEGALADFVHRFIPARPQERVETAIPRPLPTLLLLHGTGGNENDLLELGRRLLPGAALLSPRGRALENGAPRFFRRLAEGVFDVPDLKLRTHELADFIAVAADAYHFDASHVIAVGYSNGANIAASLLLLRPGVLAGAVLFHPMVPLIPDLMPELDGTPIFIGAGRNDPLVPVENTERLITLFERCGARVTTAWHQGGHNLGREELREAQIWLSPTTP